MPSCAAVIMAPSRLLGVHWASCGVVLIALKTMRVNLSGVIVAGSAFLISGIICWIRSCTVFFGFAIAVWASFC